MSRRRNQPDPLKKVDRVMWLVIKDAALSTVHSIRRLEPNCDLKAELAAERLKHVDGGWEVDPLTRYTFVFAKRGAERIQINVQALHPDEPITGHGTFLGVEAPRR
jgi:hypothetical protein